MLAPPETLAFFCSSTLCARMQAVPKALPLWSAELRTKRLDHDQLERLDSGLRACAAGGGAEAQQVIIIPDIRINARYRRYPISVYCNIVYT
jgi:hypothetical protein